MKRPHRKRRLFGQLGIAAIVLLLAGAIVVRAVLTQERLRTEVVRLTQEATGLDTTLDDAALSWSPFGISLRGLRIAGETPQAPPLLQLDSGLLRLQIGPLLARRIVVERIELNAPVVELQQVDGVVRLPGRLGEPVPAPAPSTGGGGLAERAGRKAAREANFEGTIEQLAIRDGRIRLHPDETSPEGALELAGIGVDARVDAEANFARFRSQGRLHLSGLEVAALDAYRETLDRLEPKVAFDLAFDSAAGTLVIDSAELHADPLELTFLGRITGIPETPAIELELAPRTLTLEELLPLIPPAMFPEGRVPRASGPVTLAATIRGPLGDPASPPETNARIMFDGATLGTEGFDVELRDLRGTVVAAGNSLELESLEARLGDGSFAVNGRVEQTDVPDSTRYDLTVRGDLDLAVAGRTGALPEGTTLAGKLDVDARIVGKAAAPQDAQLDGTATLANGRYESVALPAPVTNLTASATLEGADIVLSRLEGRIGSSHFAGNGRVFEALDPTPLIRLDGRSERLDLVELLPPPPTAAAAGDADGATAAPPADPRDALPLVPVIPPIRADFTLAIDSLLTVGATLADVDLSASLRDERAVIFTTAGGARIGEGIVGERLTANLILQDHTMYGDFRAPQLLAQRVPLTDVRGKLNLDADKQLAVEEVTAAVWTGRVEGRADVDLSRRADPRFVIESRASGLQANDFLTALTPADDLLFGVLDIESTFEGHGVTPDVIAANLTGRGDVQTREGRLNRGPQTNAIWKAMNLDDQESIPFEDLVAAFTVADGQLRTKDLLLDGGDASWKANGFVGFDGALDYTVEVALNEALSRQFRARVGGGLASLLQASTGAIVLDLKIDGDVRKPRVGVDREKLAARARDNAADALKDEIEKQKDKLSGALKNLLGK